MNPNNPDFLVDIQGVNGEITQEKGYYLDMVEIPALGEWLSFNNVPVVLLDIASPEGGTLDGIIGNNKVYDGTTSATVDLRPEIGLITRASFVDPDGALTAAQQLGRGLKNLIVFNSLSKRSNVPGMRSGLVAGDAELMKQFLLYRTYHGSAMSPVVQAASIAAWNDEEHVIENRRQYAEKFAAVMPLLKDVLQFEAPDAAFYLWARVPGGDDTAFARELFRTRHVTVLPGSYLARDAASVNPGKGFVRIALVDSLPACVEAAKRIVEFVRETA